MLQTTADPRDALQTLLRGFSIELTPGDDKSIDAASRLLPAGTETFIVGLPRTRAEDVVSTAVRLRQSGMTPVPHLVARNFASEFELDSFLCRLSDQAGIERTLVIGGDRDMPVGPYDSSLQLIQSGLLEKHGIKSIYVACYPEGHPRIASDRLTDALVEKFAAARNAGFKLGLISQFCFDAGPIFELATRLRSHNAPYRVGVAGPTNRVMLLKYAVKCGVGKSMRALRDHASLAKNLLSGETPEQLLKDIASGQANDPELGISGVHFFAFGSLAKSAQLISALVSGKVSADLSAAP